MKKYVIWGMLSLLTVMSFSVKAQMPIDSSHEVWGTLDGSVQKKLTRADKIMKKAVVLNQKTEAYEKQIEALRNDNGRIQVRKIRKIEQKRDASIVQSKPYFQDAFNYTYSALTKQLTLLQKQGLQPDNADLAGGAKERFKQAKKLYQKADRTDKPRRQTEMIVLGGQKMREAIDMQLTAVKKLLGPKPDTNAEAALAVDSMGAAALDSVALVPVDSLVAPALVTVGATDTVNIATVLPQPVAVAPVVAPVAVVPPVLEHAVAADNTPRVSNVFITVQIMALKSAATPDQLKQVYSGTEQVMELVSGEYYRYAIGKFSSVAKAKEAMATKGIKGIVVAFRGTVRISVTEALSELNAGN
jgi:hypothetical protein